jgi:hypothetical protein
MFLDSSGRIFVKEWCPKFEQCLSLDTFVFRSPITLLVQAFNSFWDENCGQTASFRCAIICRPTLTTTTSSSSNSSWGNSSVSEAFVYGCSPFCLSHYATSARLLNRLTYSFFQACSGFLLTAAFFVLFTDYMAGLTLFEAHLRSTWWRCWA